MKKNKTNQLKEDIKTALILSTVTILPCMLMFLHWLYIGY